MPSIHEPWTGRSWDVSPHPIQAPTDFDGCFLEERQARSFTANSLQPQSSNKRNLVLCKSVNPMPSLKGETWAQSGWRTQDSGEFTAERGKALDHGWLHRTLILDSKSWCPGLLSCTEWNLIPRIGSVQSFSRVQLFATSWTAACHVSLSITNSRSLLKLMVIESVMPSNHLILCHPLLLPPSVFPSIRVFSNGSVLHIRWSKYWSFSLSISPSNENSGLISFRMDWLDLLAVQGTLKSLLQHYSSKASILRRSAFFVVQLSHPCMTPGKTTALTRRLRGRWIQRIWEETWKDFLPPEKWGFSRWRAGGDETVVIVPSKFTDTVSTQALSSAVSTLSQVRPPYLSQSQKVCQPNSKGLESASTF